MFLQNGALWYEYVSKLQGALVGSGGLSRLFAVHFGCFFLFYPQNCVEFFQVRRGAGLRALLWQFVPTNLCGSQRWEGSLAKGFAVAAFPRV
jgi:hypothetical protein